MFASNQLPLIIYLLVLLLVALAGSWAISHVRSISSPSPMVEVTL